jgi:nicotinate dehydrogenase subunit A
MTWASGPKFGCGLAMRVLHGHRQGRRCSCITPVRPWPAEITTLEGLGTIEKPHPIQKAFIDEQAVQCGFCLSGVILTAKVALDRNPKATGAQLQQALSNVLCRCGAHTRMMKAIRKYQQEGVRA